VADGVEVRADLRFTAEVPGFGPVDGALTGRGRDLELRVSNPVFFAGRGDAALVRGIAAALAELGLRISVIADERLLLELGATRTGWIQRRLTGSRHLRVVGPRGVLAGVRGSRSTRQALPGRELLPPTTLFPLAPTFRRGPAAPVTTTHDPRRGGNPRLVLAVGSGRRPDDGRVVHPLRGETTTFGSHADSDVRLTGVAPEQAVVVHDEDDELVLVDRAGDGTTRVNGLPVERRILRSGNRVELGSWTFAYWRAEYADHGRPYGGRIGGELGHQRAQPGRHRLAPPSSETGP
jgi:hypothetical protein